MSRKTHASCRSGVSLDSIRKNPGSKTGKFSKTSPNFHSYKIRPRLNENSFLRTLVLGLFSYNLLIKKEEV
ncbi:hypothetical protein EHR06_08160 [Leptospira dzoumogneensis]|uniref:Uncharacterized protein n=1 Tax=Leptospira dzoumogneensis TaxID=2484904 RepID=A0A4Z1AV37_9LEPT|nr:hypothetical protein EHR06_08160 [Leptospira dzoumogneensis]